jgi:hypothetical protein
VLPLAKRAYLFLITTILLDLYIHTSTSQRNKL